MVMDNAVHDDSAADAMQCPNHPYRGNSAAASPGGICAFCLQDKLGKLVSSSSSAFRSDPSNSNSNATASLSLIPSSDALDHTASRPRIPFLNRSKSAVVPRRPPDDYAGSRNRKRAGFWSFLYHPKPKPAPQTQTQTQTQTTTAPPRKQKRADYVVVVDESVDNSNTMPFGGKVSRSRSVGCGSRSFSGDFFDRISGLGDCTLRRVESQREGRRCSTGDAIQEKVRCAGIFGGFMMTSSSSSYWLPEQHQHVNGRSRTWGWPLPSPMRALTKPSPSSSSSTRELKSAATNSNADADATPNLAAIPSLLTARG